MFYSGHLCWLRLHAVIASKRGRCLQKQSEQGREAIMPREKLASAEWAMSSLTQTGLWNIKTSCQDFMACFSDASDNSTPYSYPTLHVEYSTYFQLLARPYWFFLMTRFHGGEEKLLAEKWLYPISPLLALQHQFGVISLLCSTLLRIDNAVLGC